MALIANSVIIVFINKQLFVSNHLHASFYRSISTTIENYEAKRLITSRSQEPYQSNP